MSVFIIVYFSLNKQQLIHPWALVIFAKSVVESHSAAFRTLFTISYYMSEQFIGYL